MGVIMQAFFWDCPKIEGKEYQWWNHVKGEIPSLKQAGFTALWLPPASKAANVGGMSMGTTSTITTTWENIRRSRSEK
jgi:alpha-amylase